MTSTPKLPPVLGSENIECPHCLIKVHAAWRSYLIPQSNWWHVASTECASCGEMIAHIIKAELDLREQEWVIESRHLVLPARRNTPAINSEAVPAAFKGDYIEACDVLEISPKASAVLSRRVLQSILKEEGYTSKNLIDQINAVLQKTGEGALPASLRETIDVIRHFGNFSAHPITEETTLQVVDIEPGEAEWCLEIIRELLTHYYIEPDRRKKRIEEARTKIGKSGKELLPKEE